jgi:hypothetical protein
MMRVLDDVGNVISDQVISLSNGSGRETGPGAGIPGSHNTTGGSNGFLIYTPDEDTAISFEVLISGLSGRHNTLRAGQTGVTVQEL